MYDVRLTSNADNRFDGLKSAFGVSYRRDLEQFLKVGTAFYPPTVAWLSPDHTEDGVMSLTGSNILREFALLAAYTAIVRHPLRDR